jgi:hypothetical protein
MDRTQVTSGEGRGGFVRTATVIGDRFSRIDGAVAQFASSPKAKGNLAAVAKFFGPHLECLAPGGHAPIDTASKSDFALDAEGEDTWAREKRLRTIFAEEIQGELTKYYPGLSTAEKKAKADLLEGHFGTRSWTKVEGLPSDRLRAGLVALRAQLGAEARGELPAAPVAAGAGTEAAQGPKDGRAAAGVDGAFDLGDEPKRHREPGEEG